MTLFEVWAPQAEKAELVVDGTRHVMTAAGRPGWWRLDVNDAGPGTDYAYSLDGGEPLPDPRSLWQPHGVHGPSRVVDHAAFPWTDGGWHGRALPGSVCYELHIGTFTAEGTFDAAIGRLDHLAGLGVDLVEVMPVNAFPGRHGWGYDGVGLWAVQDSYGGPDGFKRFVDACHARGLGVILDVVYNHLGPSGNYLSRFGPYFTEKHKTPWGPAVNLDDAGSDEVRAFIVGNTLSWLRDYHVDGLRLDAVHAFADDRAVHLLEELSVAADALGAATGRPLFLVAESDLNDPRIVTAREAGGHGMHAQWNDDFHHALHCLLTGERQGYYGDFGSLPCLAKTLTRVFYHDGTWSSFRGRSHGRPVDTARIPAHRFVVSLQNHDQIGNRATGDRITASLSPGLLRVGAALLLTAPFTPMLFMGEEWGATTPWQYFTDHVEPELAAAVSRGRREEFGTHGWGEAEVPDPQDEETFTRSKLDWSEPGRAPHAELLEWYRQLISLRRAHPELTDPDLTRVRVDFGEDARWLVMRRAERLRVVVNLAEGEQVVSLDGPVTEVLAASGTGCAPEGDGMRLPGGTAVIVAVSGTVATTMDEHR